MAKEKKVKNKRKWYFGFLKKLMKIKYKQPTFIYLGEEITSGGVILSNHEGTDAPMAFEIYSNKPIRFWGTHQMNSGLKMMYKYQSEVYYHEKKGWKLFPAKLFCLIASPLTNLFYKGLNLISTYPDARFIKTIRQSIEAIKAGENIIILPEKSNNGYQRTLEGFHGGFALFAESCLREGIDLPVYVAYYNKKKNLYLIDVPVNYSILKAHYPDREELSEVLCNRCNALGEMTYDDSFTAKYQKVA